MEESILGLPHIEPTPSFEVVHVKKETEEEDLIPVEYLNICDDMTFKEEMKLEETLILDDDMTPTDTLYQCQHCYISFNQPQYLRRHEKTHKERTTTKCVYACNKCVKRFSSPQKLEKHLLIHDRKATHGCALCDKSCKTATALMVHQRTHTKKMAEPQAHTCDTCGKCFSEKYNLMVHVRSHTGTKPYACETCAKRFTTNSSLTVHRRTHSGERPYECTICNKRFSTSSYLTEHNRSHSNECPYSCTACTKKFKTAKLLKNHKAVHDADVQLVECDKCGKMLKTESAKLTHDRDYCPKVPKHANEYVKEVNEKKVVTMGCKVCRKEFTGKFRRPNLRRHMRLHTKYRPYKCDKCDATYSDWTAWKSHTRTHSTEKPFRCEQCDLYFKSPNNLSRHNLNIHRLGKKTTLKPGNKK